MPPDVLAYPVLLAVAAISFSVSESEFTSLRGGIIGSAAGLVPDVEAASWSFWSELRTDRLTTWIGERGTG